MSVSRVPDASERRVDAQATYERIVGAATRMILSREPLTMTALAKVAGISRPTLYDHFPSLDAVVEAAVDRALHGARGSFSTASPELSPEEAMRELLRQRWQSLAEHADLYRLASDVLPPGRLHALHGTTQDGIAELVDRGRSSGAFSTDLPTPWLVAVIYGLLHQAAEEVLAGRVDREHAGELLARTVLTTLGT
jgi:TetR/AcrR family transcriptional regulator, mexCD-oprJ operon repressor